MRLPASPRTTPRTIGRRPKRTKISARPINIPPPVGGWNARDSLDSMNPTDAVSITNWFPRQSDVVSRPGYEEHCDTDLGATLKTLIPFEYGGTSKMLACGGSEIVDVTTADTPSSLASGFNNSDWVSDIINGTKILANGVDSVQNYNGSAVSASGFTGVTLSTLNFVKIHKSRAYFVEKDSTSMWYGGTNTIAGALTEFDFATVHSVKGKLKLLATMTGDGGDGGSDDIFLAIFSGGTVIAYNGSNPGDASNWSLVGVYEIGIPLSRFGILAGDGDVVVLTSRGYERIGSMIKAGSFGKESKLISAKIQLAVLAQIKSLGVSDDWKLSVYPNGQMLIITVPQTGDARHMHVQNINTNAWTRFSGFYPTCWAMLGTQPYFGDASGVVNAFDNGVLTDDGASVRCDAQPAWNFFRNPGWNKELKLIRPFFKTEVYPAVAIAAGVDFNEILLGTFGAAESGDFAEWDTAEWDVATWAPESLTYSKWYHRPALGDAIGLRIAADVSVSEVRWNMTKCLYTLGGLV